MNAETADEEPRVDDVDRAPDIPADAVAEAERLTRLAREATDPAAARSYRDRRDALADVHDYTPRLREEDDTLVLYPSEWVEGGTVRFERIEDTDRAVEVSLSGPGDADRYREVAAYNDVVAEAVAETVETEAHAENARRFATFMSNHYVRPVDEATPETRAEFREEYLPRNGWPSDDQLAVVEKSLAVIAEVADAIDEADVEGPDADGIGGGDVGGSEDDVGGSEDDVGGSEDDVGGSEDDARSSESRTDG